ncbi:uncharacterized protein LOC143037363 [Oratosquilla oratoria]|uniref:uncharacterized protein LOC143037363 n=1 Tax=Oratosquilla oratoria TaxID=337810 RepID=UPI003F7592B1
MDEDDGTPMDDVDSIPEEENDSAISSELASPTPPTTQDAPSAASTITNLKATVESLQRDLARSSPQAAKLLDGIFVILSSIIEITKNGYDTGKVRTATYVSKGLAARPGSFPGPPLEEGYGGVTSVTVQGDRSIHILNYYNPVTTCHFEWLGALPDDWIVVGDFNRRDALWEDGYPHSSPEITSQLDTADVVLLNDGGPTRMPDNPNYSTSVIDLSFVSPNIAGITEWAVLDDPLSSDHLPITITPPVTEELNSLLTDTVLAAARAAIPVTATSQGRRGHLWWTDECKEAVERKKLAYQRYMREGSEAAYTAMKQTKATCKKTIAKAKLNHWKNTKEDTLDLRKRGRGSKVTKATKKSPGANQITYPLLRHLTHSYQGALLAIYNKCWREGVVPTAWKHAIVVPIPKVGKKRNLVENYRPVALTFHVGKVYERIVLNRLSHHVEANGLLPKLQPGFRKGRSVIDHVVKLSEHIRRAQRQRGVLHTCFLDISKAFDSVWHAKLLWKLKSIGVSPAIFGFTKSFLSDRTIAVRWRGTPSPQAKIDMGVPQGSVVAPLLFTLLLAGVGKGVRSDTVVTAYADDIALWRKSKHRRPQQSSANHQAEVKTFQKQVDVVVNHLSNLGFTLSATKTIYMPVHGIGLNRRQYPEWNQVTVCGMAVKPSASVRYLGVIFQCDGRWNKHLQQVCLSARRALNLIRAIRREKWGQRRETLIPIIQNLVRSRLLFGAPALHDLPKTAVEKMARVECHALRLGLGLSQGVPQAQVYNEAGLLPLWHRLKRDACTYLFSSARVPNSTDEEMYETWNSASTPVPIHGLPVSVRELCKTAKIQPGERRQIAQCQVDPFPPWALTPPEVELDLPGLSRRDDPHMLAACAREMITVKYPHDFLAYTDGSVLSDGRTGAGIYLQDTKETFSLKLPPPTTILTAELIAIREAMRKMITLPHPPKQATVFSDSKSSLAPSKMQAARHGPFPATTHNPRQPHHGSRPPQGRRLTQCSPPCPRGHTCLLLPSSRTDISTHPHPLTHLPTYNSGCM